MDSFCKGTGIVCEYNPFHKGHAYQIEGVKKMGAEFVVCAMSGDFVQRGEPSFQDKRERAENAVKNGADIVLEIPFPFSSLGAEGFAKAGVSILENSGLCSSFAFGSECADVEKLKRIACLATSDFHKRVICLQKENPSIGYAAAREKLIANELGEEYAEIIRKPNDILGVEYLKANKSMVPIAIKRTTPRGGFDDNFASSSYIRKNLSDTDERDFVLSCMPKDCCLEKVYASDEAFYKHVLLSLMQKNPLVLSDVAEVAKGSEHSIVKNAKKAENFYELCSLLSSKTMTDAKIRRMLLFSFFGVTKKMAKTTPLYTEVLATSENGRKMLKKYAEDRKIIVASRVAEIKKDKEAFEQYEFSRLSGEILAKCRRLAP